MTEKNEAKIRMVTLDKKTVTKNGERRQCEDTPAGKGCPVVCEGEVQPEPCDSQDCPVVCSGHVKPCDCEDKPCDCDDKDICVDVPDCCDCECDEDTCDCDCEDDKCDCECEVTCDCECDEDTCDCDCEDDKCDCECEDEKQQESKKGEVKPRTAFKIAEEGK